MTKLNPWKKRIQKTTLPETNSDSTWKLMAGRWNFLLGYPIFRCYVSFSETKPSKKKKGEKKRFWTASLDEKKIGRFGSFSPKSVELVDFSSWASRKVAYQLHPPKSRTVRKPPGAVMDVSLGPTPPQKRSFRSDAWSLFRILPLKKKEHPKKPTPLRHPESTNALFLEASFSFSPFLTFGRHPTRCVGNPPGSLVRNRGSQRHSPTRSRPQPMVGATPFVFLGEV